MKDDSANAAADGEPGEKEGISQAEAERLKRSARLGVFALLARTVILQLAVLGGNVALARLLEPGDFGVFAIAQFALSFFVFFGDVGLGGALIRQKEEPTEQQLSSVFFFQIGLSVVVMTVVGVAASAMPWIWPGLPKSAPWVVRALAIDLLLTAFRIVPSILMERKLQFGRLAVIEVIVSLSFYVVALTLAALDMHVWALAGGVMFQGVVSLAATYITRPWRPRLHFDREVLRPLIKFGLTYQSKNIIALVNGAITPLYAGAMLGAREVGYINWAQSTAYFPLKLVDIMARVNFPLYSRLQGDRKLFAETLSRSIQVCAVVTMVIVAIFFGMGSNLIQVVYTDKWMPSLPLLHIYAGAVAIGFLAPIVGAALDASGRPEIFFRLAIGWTALNWIIVVFTTPAWGMVGFSGGYVVHVIVGNIVVIFLVKKLIPEATIWPRIRSALVAAIGTALLSRYVLSPWASGPLSFTAAVVLCVLVFAAVLAVLDPPAVREALSFLRGEQAGVGALSSSAPRRS